MWKPCAVTAHQGARLTLSENTVAHLTRVGTPMLMLIAWNLFVFPLCGFSLSLFCNYWKGAHATLIRWTSPVPGGLPYLQVYGHS